MASSRTIAGMVEGKVLGPAPRVRVELLGGLRVSVDGRDVDDRAWKLRKAKHLVKLLALAPQHRLPRERVLDMLWPDLDPSAAANNFRHTLHVSRRALDPSGSPRSRILEQSDGVLALAPPDQIWVDVAVFTDLARVARHSRDPRAYERAIALYRGDLLPEDPYEDWAAGQREQLCALHVSLLNEVAQLHERAGRAVDAVAGYERAIGIDPTNEDAHAALMRLHARAGDRRRALRQYEILREALRRELDAEPDQSIELLREQILGGALGSAEPVTGRAAHNLPVQLTTFVGRERELSRVREALAAGRLVTLTGAGGSGKTRLALETAGSVLDEYPEGVWLVELAPLSDGSLIAPAIVRAMGERADPAREPLDWLAGRIGPRRLLLVLDNCEHLVAGAAAVAGRLLARCPEVRILATSRRSLAIAGEVLLEVPPLSVPDLARAGSLADLETEAVHLFLQRAKLVRPEFRLRDGNAATVARICVRLDGMPLALELAAAQLRAHSVEELASRLDDRFRVLVSDDERAMERHRSLQDAIDWSYEQLEPAERVLFERLSVFPGGWTVGSAQEIASDDPLARFAVSAILERLVDRSLVVVEAWRDESVRYRMLETVRTYARERLVARDGEAEAVARRHAAYVAHVADEAEPKLRGPEGARWLAVIEDLHEDVRLALRYYRDRGDRAALARLAGALGWFWYQRGYESEGREWLGVARREGEPDGLMRWRVLNALGILERIQGDLVEGSATFEEALRVARDVGDRRAVSITLNALALVAQQRGELERAFELHAESLGLAEALGDRIGTATALNNLGLLAMERGDLESSAGYLERALTLAREIGYAKAVSAALQNLGIAMHAQDRLDRAAELFEEALELSRSAGDRRAVGVVQTNLALARHDAGDDGAARVLYAEALPALEAARDKLGIAEALVGLASLELRAGRPARAVMLLGAVAAAAPHLRRMALPARSARERVDRCARADLPGAVVAEALAAGGSLTLEAAAAQALTA